MLILGIDSSTKAGTASLLTEDKLVGEKLLNLDQTHSQRLMPQIIDLMTSCGYQPEELTGIGVAKGPGSFTGTRIGLATAKTLAQSLELPIVGISTLKVLAYSLKHVSSYICPLIDARGGRLFTGLYRVEDRLKLEAEETMVNKEDLLEYLADIQSEVYLVGNIVNKYRAEFESQLVKPQFVTELFNLPRGGAVAELAANRLTAGEADDLFALTPNYLKRSQAEIQWEQKQN